MTHKLHISTEHLLSLLKQMLRIRRFEEKCAELYSLQKIRGFLHLYVGEEAVAVGAMSALKPEDFIVSTYREHGHALARGLAMGAIMAEMYGKSNGCSRGRGGSMHLFDAKSNFYGGNAISGVACLWRWVWRWRLKSGASIRPLPCVFLARGRWRKERFMRA